MNRSESVQSANFNKPAVQNSFQKASKRSLLLRAHWRLVITVALCVFLAEAFVMIAIHPFLQNSNILFALFDAFILVLIISPVLYAFVFRPLVQQINEREQAEQALRESEMRFRTVFRTSPDSITVSRLQDARIFDANEGFCELSGYSRNEVLGKSALDIQLWNDRQDRAKMIADLQEHGSIDNFEADFKRKDGRIIPCLISARVIILDGEPHILAVARDISELKKNEKTLLASQNFLQISNRHTEMDPLLKEFLFQIKRLTDCSAIGMRVLDEDGNIPYQAYEGFSPEFYQAENHILF